MATLAEVNQRIADAKAELASATKEPRHMSPYIWLFFKVLSLFYTGAVTYIAAYGHADWAMVIVAGLAPALGYLGGIADTMPAPWHTK